MTLAIFVVLLIAVLRPLSACGECNLTQIPTLHVNQTEENSLASSENTKIFSKESAVTPMELSEVMAVGLESGDGGRSEKRDSAEEWLGHSKADILEGRTSVSVSLGFMKSVPVSWDPTSPEYVTIFEPVTAEPANSDAIMPNAIEPVSSDTTVTEFVSSDNLPQKLATSESVSSDSMKLWPVSSDLMIPKSATFESVTLEPASSDSTNPEPLSSDQMTPEYSEPVSDPLTQAPVTLKRATVSTDPVTSKPLAPPNTPACGDGMWSQWSGWSACNSAAKKQRIRQCYGHSCYGEATELANCKFSSTPMSHQFPGCGGGLWSQWSGWSACGSGAAKKQRVRLCFGCYCEGSKSELADCHHSKPIKPNGGARACGNTWNQWSGWSGWSACNNAAKRQRIRRYFGCYCRGNAMELANCYGSKEYMYM